MSSPDRPDDHSIDQLTYAVIGCAMRIHSALGNGFQEVIYQRCLAHEFRKLGLAFAREVDQEVFYDGIRVGKRRADFVVEGRLIVELKAVVALQDVHLAQAKNYVVAYGSDDGLLFNFGARSLEYRRVYGSRGRG